MHRVLVFGATGRTGTFVVEAALAHGLEVVALVRTPDKLPKRAGLEVVRGSPESDSDVQRAFAGCDAVVSALNNNRTSDLPWAKSVSPPNLMTDAMINAVRALKANGKRRVVTLSANGVGDSFQHVSFVTRLAIRKTNLSAVYRDHEGQETVLRASGLDWTAVRAVGLINRDAVKTLVLSEHGTPPPALTISRKNVAAFMVDALERRELFGKALTVSER